MTAGGASTITVAKVSAQNAAKAAAASTGAIFWTRVFDRSKARRLLKSLHAKHHPRG